MKFDLQLFGGLFGGGGGETQIIEKPVVQSSAPSASPVQNTSETDSEKSKKKRFTEQARGRRATITGAGTTQGALSAAGSIAKTLLGEEQRKKTLGGA
jgi:hypothetical protein